MHLRRLMCKFRAQELSMIAVATSLEAELETWHRETAMLRQCGDDAVTRSRLCTDLQLQCDRLANDLTHVRMAIAGATEALAEHEAQLWPSRDLARRRARDARVIARAVTPAQGLPAADSGATSILRNSQTAPSACNAI
ncbi:MAG TPA: hypothetical protein VF384_00090 [Planctomycetota bacterium]